MKTRPILFSAPMVRAILAGTKTQTRRIVKPQPAAKIPIKPYHRPDGTWDWVLAETGIGSCMAGFRCPYGVPGDRLWVRETWCELIHTSPATNEPVLCDGDKLIEHATRRANGKGWNYDGTVIAYRATSDIEFCDGDGFSGDQANRDDMPRWKPSIHMPRAFSRLTLEITDVRVQRLQEISRGDCCEEGWPTSDANRAMTIACRDAGCDDTSDDSAIEWYADLWESINGAGSWAANPWVWALTFKRVQP